ncbi:MAG: histidine kinase dimerization/phospho-acceptor domain-containing protein [Terriglobia bacterium]|nr:histidine kinase dimerization/phospho-acceptor domain-containing protein [Terriglobia bacterium]
MQDEEFRFRNRRPRGRQAGIEAFHRLAHVFAAQPAVLLQELCDAAVEFSGADSAGISLEEAGANGELRFRWVAISGSFAAFLNGTTPRFFSPCGTALSAARPQLYRVTRKYYDLLGIEAEPITDGILIPWVADSMRGTLWCVSHHSREAFDFDDYKLLNGLADFAAIAIRHQKQQEILLSRQKAAAYVEAASELAHELNNPLQSLTSALYLLERGPEDSRRFVKLASAELIRLADIVRELLNLKEAA